jgi:hypothetical protein
MARLEQILAIQCQPQVGPGLPCHSGVQLEIRRNRTQYGPLIDMQSIDPAQGSIQLNVPWQIY